MAKRAEQTGIDAGFVMSHLVEMLKADIGDIVTDAGTFKPLEQWPLIFFQELD